MRASHAMFATTMRALRAAQNRERESEGQRGAVVVRRKVWFSILLPFDSEARGGMQHSTTRATSAICR